MRPPRRPRLRLAIVGAERFAQLPARATLRRWILMALHADAQITLVFVDARTGRSLNRRFRGRDYATNVLTFAYAEAPRVAAEIVLCIPVLRREARAQGKTLRAHFAHLLVHGMLHAQGYDHVRERDAQRMQAAERRLLARLRIADPYAVEAQ